MNNCVSHIKGVDHFDLIWNKRIDTYSSYFSQTLACSLALNFGFFGFLRSLYADINIRGLDNLSIDPRHIIAYNDPALSKTSYTEYTQGLADSINVLFQCLNYYEVKKKNIKIEKVTAFVLDSYRYPSEQNSLSITLPFPKEDIYSMFFQDFYPSLKTSLVSFLESKFLLSSNKKNTYTFMQKYEMNNEDMSFINYSLNNASLVSVNEDVNLRISSLVATLHSELIALSNSYSTLLQDKIYLESKVKDLYDSIDLEKKQGMNGYLRTWH